MDDPKKILPQLKKTTSAIEDLLISGLTTASSATVKTLNVTFQEASRLKLLRLGSTLRSTCQELTRFVEDDENFSQQRLVFFLHRSWLLCKGLQDAIKKKDTKRQNNLLWTPESQVRKSARVVCVGAIKKVAANHFCAFEFRFRELDTGESLTWSSVFPLKKRNKIPPEGFLHLPQKQKFRPIIFTQGKVFLIQDFSVSTTQFGGRIQLNEDSLVSEVEGYDKWSDWLQWSPKKALAAIQNADVSPFDVDIEMQTDIAIEDYQLGEMQVHTEPDRKVWPLQYKRQTFSLCLSGSIEGQAAEKAIGSEIKKAKKRGHFLPMFGTLHYSKMELIISPISFVDRELNALQFINLSEENIDQKALLSALSF